MKKIAITPENGSFGFIIKYDSNHINIPGHVYETSFFIKDDEDENSALRMVLEEDFGCSYNQINDLKNFILKGFGGFIDERGSFCENINNV